MNNTAPERIVSLLPAATEILFELGVGGRIVGVSEDCDWPAAVRDLPSVSSSVVDSSESSRSIDRQVREAHHAGRSLYHVDESLMDRLDPDLVVTQEQCEVCAPDFEEVRDSCRRLEGDPDVLSLEPKDLETVLGTIDDLADAVGAQEEGGRLINRISRRQDRLGQLGKQFDRSPRVACIEWLNPIFVGGHWIPEMVDELGGDPLGTPGGHSHEIEWDDVLEHDPSRVILMPCGFETERAEQEGKELLRRVRSDPGTDCSETIFYAADGSSYYSRPGPRLWEGIAMMGVMMYPRLRSEVDFPSDSFVELE